jgi:hypothetical protein
VSDKAEIQIADRHKYKSADCQNDQKCRTPKKYYRPTDNSSADRSRKPPKAEPQQEAISHDAIDPSADERNSPGSDTKDQTNLRKPQDRGKACFRPSGRASRAIEDRRIKKPPPQMKATPVFPACKQLQPGLPANRVDPCCSKAHAAIALSGSNVSTLGVAIDSPSNVFESSIVTSRSPSKAGLSSSVR